MTVVNSRKVLLSGVVILFSMLACGQYVTAVPTTLPDNSTSTPPAPTQTALVPTATPRSTDANTAVVIQALVNVRQEPDGAVIGTVQAGEAVTVVECVDGWCKISLSEQVFGWIYQGCLSIADGQRCEAK